MWCIYVLLLMLAFHGLWMLYSLHNKYMRLMREKVTLPVEEAAIPRESVETELEEEPDTEPVLKQEGEEFVEKATKITLDNLKDNDFNIDDLCREMGMSRTLFYVKLKTYTGKSPQDFVRAIRLEKASTLLRQGRTVTEVSILTGFDNPKYFSTVFKKYFGISPSKYS